jgi:hypothetical protein
VAHTTDRFPELSKQAISKEGPAAPQAVTRQLQAALDAPEPGGFDLRSYPDGALLVGPGGLSLLTAGVGGIGPAQALTGAFGTVAAKTGQHLSVIDVVPPLREDSEAFSVFFVILGVLFPSLVAGIASSLVLRRSPSTWRVAVLVVVAAMIGLVAAAIADGVTGFGHFLAIAGTVALFSLAISAPAALARSKPTPAIPAFLGFVVLGIPVSGGPGALAPFSPRFLRVLDPVLPLGVAVDALRSTVYFHGHDVTEQLLVLAVWTAVGVVALVLIVSPTAPADTLRLPWPGCRRPRMRPADRMATDRVPRYGVQLDADRGMCQPAPTLRFVNK